MGVEPTLDQEAGRATVLKTACRVILRCFHGASLRHQMEFKAPYYVQRAVVTRAGTQFGAKSGVKKLGPLSALSAARSRDLGDRDQQDHLPAR